MPISASARWLLMRIADKRTGALPLSLVYDLPKALDSYLTRVYSTKENDKQAAGSSSALKFPEDVSAPRARSS